MKALAQDIKNAISGQISGTLMRRFLQWRRRRRQGAYCDDTPPQKAHTAAIKRKEMMKREWATLFFSDAKGRMRGNEAGEEVLPKRAEPCRKTVALWGTENLLFKLLMWREKTRRVQSSFSNHSGVHFCVKRRQLTQNVPLNIHR